MGLLSVPSRVELSEASEVEWEDPQGFPLDLDGRRLRPGFRVLDSLHHLRMGTFLGMEDSGYAVRWFQRQSEDEYEVVPREAIVRPWRRKTTKPPYRGFGLPPPRVDWDGTLEERRHQRDRARREIRRIVARMIRDGKFERGLIRRGRW